MTVCNRFIMEVWVSKPTGWQFMTKTREKDTMSCPHCDAELKIRNYEPHPSPDKEIAAVLCTNLGCGYLEKQIVEARASMTEGPDTTSNYRRFSHWFKRSGSNAANCFFRALLFNPYTPWLSLNFGNRCLRLGLKDDYIYNFRNTLVSPTPSDTVVEAGVLDGRDTATYAKMASKVVAFEPSPRNYNIAKDNLARFDNVELINAGLWKEDDTMVINYGAQRGDDGFLTADAGSEDTEYEIPVNTIEAFAEKLDLESVDFLKVEAEGAELEILKGIGDLDIKKIAVNASEERRLASW